MSVICAAPQNGVYDVKDPCVFNEDGSAYRSRVHVFNTRLVYRWERIIDGFGRVIHAWPTTGVFVSFHTLGPAIIAKPLNNRISVSMVPLERWQQYAPVFVAPESACGGGPHSEWGRR